MSKKNSKFSKLHLNKVNNVKKTKSDTPHISQFFNQSNFKGVTVTMSNMSKNVECTDLSEPENKRSKSNCLEVEETEEKQMVYVTESSNSSSSKSPDISRLRKLENTAKRISKIEESKTNKKTMLTKFFKQTGDDSICDFDTAKRPKLHKNVPPKSTRKRQIKPKKQRDIRKAMNQNKEMSDEQLFSNLIVRQSTMENVDPEQLQVALALSLSMSEASQSNSASLDIPVTKESNQDIKNFLQHFRFQSSNNDKNIDLKQFLCPSKNCKKSSALTRRNPDIQNRKASEKLALLLTSSLSNNFNFKDVSLSFRPISHYLRDLFCKDKKLFLLNCNESRTENNLKDYYIANLFEVSLLKPNCLLKQWNNIPGRDLSPEKDSIYNMKILNDNNISISLQIHQSNDLENSIDESLNILNIPKIDYSRSPDMFAESDTESENMSSIQIGEENIKKNILDIYETQCMENKIQSEPTSNTIEENQFDSAVNNIKQIAVSHNIEDIIESKQLGNLSSDKAKNCTKLENLVIEIISDESNDSKFKNENKNTDDEMNFNSKGTCFALDSRNSNGKIIQVPGNISEQLPQKHEFIDLSQESDELNVSDDEINYSMRNAVNLVTYHDLNDDNFSSSSQEKNYINLNKDQSSQSTQLSQDTSIEQNEDKIFDESIICVSDSSDEETPKSNSSSDLLRYYKASQTLENRDAIYKQKSFDLSKNILDSPRLEKSLSDTFLCCKNNKLSASKLVNIDLTVENEFQVSMENLYASNVDDIPFENKMPLTKEFDILLSSNILTSPPKRKLLLEEKVNLRNSITEQLNSSKTLEINRSVTPPPNYRLMSKEQLDESLNKFGIKSLSRQKSVKILEHIYNQLHPIIDSNNTFYTKINKVTEKTIKRLEENYEQIEKKKSQLKDIKEKSEMIIVTNNVDTSDIFKETSEEILILPKKTTKKISTCALPLHIAFHNLLKSDRNLHEEILHYHPIKIDEIYKFFRGIGLKYELKDLIKFLDKHCITFRTANKK